MSRTRLVVHSGRLLARHRLRTTFMALGSLIGVAALTLVVSVGEAASRKVVNTVHQLFGGASIMVLAGGSHLLGGPRADTARLTIDDIDAVAREVPGIAMWDPLQAVAAATVRHGDATATARVLGQSERSREVWDRGVSRGDYVDDQAVSSSSRVALIGESLARKLFGQDDPIGADVLVDSVPFRITGVLERFGTDIHGMDRDNELIVPISSLQRRVMNVDTIVQAKMIVTDSSHVADTAKAVQQALRARHAIPDGRPDDFTMITAVEIQQMVRFVERVLFLYLPLVAAVCLIAGGIVAATLMLASVSDRVGEIGLRRAVGATSEDIRFQFVAETSLTIAAGGLIGLMLGYVGAAVAASHLGLGHAFSPRAALLGIGASAAVGLAAGLVPARRAAAMQPADALR
jgi:putative ABC transport system permease protein